MKKLRLLVLLLAASLARADSTVVYVQNVCPSHPQTCVSLTAWIAGQGGSAVVTSIAQSGAQVTVTCSPDWNPTSAQITQLTALLNSGQ